MPGYLQFAYFDRALFDEGEEGESGPLHFAYFDPGLVIFVPIGPLPDPDLGTSTPLGPDPLYGTSRAIGAVPAWGTSTPLGPDPLRGTSRAL